MSEEILLDRNTYTYLGKRDVAIADYTYPTPDTFFVIKKGTIISLSVRLAGGITDKPGVRP